MSFTEKLEYGYTYHIFNRGINGADLFLCPKDYEYFMNLYAKFIRPIADTYAWVLLKNHFHILVKIKDKEEIPFLRPFSSEFRSETDSLGSLTEKDGLTSANDQGSLTLTGLSTLSGQFANAKDLSGCEAADRVKVDRVEANPIRQFSHLFNGYARYFNTRTSRHGGLFETPFKRIRVDTEKYFCQLVYYIHHNPVKHGFAEHILDWGWSSYLTIISVKPTRLSRETVLGYFDDAINFKAYHQQQHDLKEIENMLLEK